MSMTKSQLIDCLNVLRGGSNTTGKLCRSDGRKCAVGTLLAAVGYSDKEIRGLKGSSVAALTYEMRQRIEERFGFTVNELCILIRKNDQHSGTARRREALVCAVCQLSGIPAAPKKGQVES